MIKGCHSGKNWNLLIILFFYNRDDVLCCLLGEVTSLADAVVFIVRMK